jgi:hypothetical protein
LRPPIFHVPQRLFDGGTFIGIFEVVLLRADFAVMTGAEFFRICRPKRCSWAIFNMHCRPTGRSSANAEGISESRCRVKVAPPEVRAKITSAKPAVR